MTKNKNKEEELQYKVIDYPPRFKWNPFTCELCRKAEYEFHVNKDGSTNICHKCFKNLVKACEQKRKLDEVYFFVIGYILSFLLLLALFCIFIR